VAVSEQPRQGQAVDVGAYCRAIESHLCLKNDGHLIRISGPAFDLVRAWAEQGVPLKIACSGIDRTFERYYRKGARRHPLHVSFCEADVLDAFDAWRRAIGVAPAHVAPTFKSASDTGVAPTSDSNVALTSESDVAPTFRSARGRGRAGRSDSLPTHLDRVANRLTLLRGAASNGPDLEAALERVVLELDALRAAARQARGAARAALLGHLESLDDELLARARAQLSPDQLSALTHDASDSLAPFRERMPVDAYAAARDRALARLIRDHAGLPIIRYDR
jgi:hypothetical protein